MSDNQALVWVRRKVHSTYFLRLICTVVIALTLASCVHRQATVSYDIVLSGGRVIDPETGLDAIRDVGIKDGVIANISTTELTGTEVLDVRGLVVAPGFIDIHSHSPTLFGARFQLLDGVTTQLDLEAGAFPVKAYGAFFDNGAPLHYGASVSHLAIRSKVLTGKDMPYLFSKNGVENVPEAFVKKASSSEIEAMRALLETGIEQGGLGIGVLLDYMSVAVSPEELRMIFDVAGMRKVPVTVHVRRGLPGEPTGLDEVIAVAEQTGTPLLICHITHSAMQDVGAWLAKIDQANARGARITTETLTYAAGGTSIGAAVFGRDWQRIFNISYGDIQWTATGEWLTKESFERYRHEQPNGIVNHHYVKEEWMETSLRWPGTMAVSDATPAFNEALPSNPNLSGTFSRFLGHYVRDRKLLPLSDALSRTSLHQARWLEEIAPAFKRKGRIQPGMDADITIFDAARVAALATYGKPYRASVGVPYVIVAGKVVVRNSELQEQVFPGKRLLGAKFSASSVPH